MAIYRNGKKQDENFPVTPKRRGMGQKAKSTAKSVPKGTRGISDPRDVKNKSVPAGTRGLQEKYDADKMPDTDPAGSYYFALEINGTEIAHFMECSGLKSTAEVFEIQEGGLNGHVHKRVGQSRWDNIVLKYATSASTAMLEWRDAFLQDKFSLRTEKQGSGSIKLMSNDGTLVRKYSFTNAWPVSWEGPTLNAGGSDLAVETLEIAHDGLKVEAG